MKGRTPALAGLAAAAIAAACSVMMTTPAQRYEDFQTPTPFSQNETLVIGFVGGLEDWNSGREGVRRLALELRSMKRQDQGIRGNTLRAASSACPDLYNPSGR